VCGRSLGREYRHTPWPIRISGHPEGAFSDRLLIRTGLSNYNLCMAALVFEQLASGKAIDIGLLVLRVLFWIIFYIGAFSMSLDSNKINKKINNYYGRTKNIFYGADNARQDILGHRHFF
jgi:hypothetical protein